MSSVAGWLVREPMPLITLESSLAVMRSELHQRLHFGEFGTQIHVLFESVEPETIVAKVNERMREKRGMASVHSLSNKTFVEINMLVEPSEITGEPIFDGLFERLGLHDVSSFAVLGEQTVGFSIDCVPDNKGMTVFEGIAIAACGNYGRFLKETEVGAQISVVGERRNAPSGEVPQFAAWFLNVLESDHESNNWQRVLERTPTNLFTIVLDGRSEELELVGLRQSAWSDGELGPYQHLFYVSDADGMHMARTSSGVGALVGRDVASDIRLVGDGAPVQFRLS